jgi:hypothetical protein
VGPNTLWQRELLDDPLLCLDAADHRVSDLRLGLGDGIDVMTATASSAAASSTIDLTDPAGGVALHVDLTLPFASTLDLELAVLCAGQSDRLVVRWPVPDVDAPHQLLVAAHQLRNLVRPMLGRVAVIPTTSTRRLEPAA